MTATDARRRVAAVAGRGPLSARELIGLVVDPGSFESWDSRVRHDSVTPDYRRQLDEARAATGEDESIVTGEGAIRGHRVALAVSEFGFLGGSIGTATAHRLISAIDRATMEGLPLVVSPASGGTRMQEGTAAFVEMLSIAAAVHRHKRSRLPYIVYLRHPTTGGVLASWASLGNVTFAEPHALVGFLGPRVYEAIHQKPFPSGVQDSDNLVARGIIDGLVEPAELGGVLASMLDVTTGSSAPGAGFSGADVGAVSRGTAWDAVLRTRRSDRPGVRELLSAAAAPVVQLSGSGAGETSSAIVIALAAFGGVGCVLIGHDRRSQADHSALGPADLRVARRGIRLARDLALPLVTVIDTPGADLSVSAEEGALAGEIARTAEDLLALDTPTVSVLMGQGCGGAAIAFLPADRVIASEHAWLSPLPLEGASAIIYRDTAHAAEMAEDQGVAAHRLLDGGIVDAVVPEGPDAAEEPVEFCVRLGRSIHREMASLLPGYRTASESQGGCRSVSAAPAAGRPGA